MEDMKYYSVMKKDELAIPWTSNSDKVLDLIKEDKDAMLLSMSGKEDEKTSEWMEHGMLETYEQQTIDQLVDTKNSQNMYLDHAFAVMDDLDKKGKYNQTPYVSALYLAAALSKKMELPEKVTWVLDLAVAYGVGVYFGPSANGSIDPKNLGIVSWKQSDADFVQKLIEQPFEPPIFNKNPVTLIFQPTGNMYYHQTAKAYQDIMELLKVNDGNFKFNNLQNNHSFELIHMAYELSKFYPKS